MNKRPYLHKRSLLVDRNVQIPILVYSIAVSTLGVTLAAAFSVYGAHLINFKASFTLSLVFITGCAFFCYSIMLIAGLYLTNKIAGPIHRMHMHMKELCEGKDPGPLTTRDDDFINKELISQYNKLVQKLKK